MRYGKTIRGKAEMLVRALVSGREATIEAGTPEEARALVSEVETLLNEPTPTAMGTPLTEDEVARARALMNVEPQRSPRSFRTDTSELEQELEQVVEPLIQAVPLANGGACEGDKCARSSKGKRRAVWSILDKQLCDRCAQRFARTLDGSDGAMSIPRQRR